MNSWEKDHKKFRAKLRAWTEMFGASALDILKLIAPKHQAEFFRFVQDGTATPQFLKYLDTDEKAKQACDIAFNVMSKQIERLAKILQKEIKP